MPHNFLPHLTNGDHGGVTTNQVQKARQLLGRSILNYGIALAKPCACCREYSYIFQLQQCCAADPLVGSGYTSLGHKTLLSWITWQT